MLTLINEKAKWIIAVAAVGIGIGLLAMDGTPKDGAARFPIGEVNGRKLDATEFDTRVKQVTENNRGRAFEDEQYASLRADIFRSFVRQYVLEDLAAKNKLGASVVEMKDELLRNPDAVRNLVSQEAQRNLYMIQANSASAEEANQRIQTYISSLPQFLLDSAFNRASYEQWLNTPEAYQWAAMVRYEQDLKNNTIPMKQLQTFIAAGIHQTSLESAFSANRSLNKLDVQVASVPASVFGEAASKVDSAAVVSYFNAQKDSFFVKEDMMRVQYASIAIAPSAKDENAIHEYVNTLHAQLMDSTIAFEELAKIQSEDPGSAQQGGLLGDYTGRGVWVKEFEDVAFALDSGKISEPVRTQFGYHIIQNLGKKTDEKGNEQVKAAHILVTVGASVETIDSLTKILNAVKAGAESGKSFAEAAKEQNLEVAESAWLGRGSNIQGIGYVQGFHSFLFANKNNPEPQGAVSSVFSNKRYVVVAAKVDSLVAGKRQVGPYFEEIRANLVNKAQAEAAKAYLESVAAKVQAWGVADSVAPEVENVKFEKATASVDEYISGLGYANPILSKIAKSQKVGEWGPALVTPSGAVMVRINAETKPSEESVAAAVEEDLQNATRFAPSALVNDYVLSLEATADVVNNLDLYYKD